VGFGVVDLLAVEVVVKDIGRSRRSADARPSQTVAFSNLFSKPAKSVAARRRT